MAIEDRALDNVERARQGIEQGIERAAEQIPPEAWPFIDLVFRITVGLAIVWLLLALVAWWRRRAYNLTIASTANVDRKAQPDFLNVDQAARKAAIERGEAHSDSLDLRDATEAAAAEGRLGMATKLASTATFLMSIFTLLASFVSAIADVTRMNGYIADASAAERIEFIIREHPIGCAVAAFVIAFNVWRFFAEKKWEKV